MIDDSDDDLRRQIRRQSDADVSDFIASLDQDETSGVPPPPVIKISEVASQPIKLDFIGFGRQGSRASPAPGSPPPSVPWACCKPDESCEMLSKAACDDAGGTWHVNKTCDEVECASCTGVVTNVEGDITANADETCPGPIHKIVSTFGAFNEPFPGSEFFYITNARNEECDGVPATYDQECEIDIECRSGNPDPDNNGWFIHLFFGGPSTCCGETSWAYNSGAFTKYAEPTDPGTGVFTFPLTLEGGSPYGSGSGTVNITIT